MIFFNQGKAYIYQDKWVVKTASGWQIIGL